MSEIAKVMNIETMEKESNDMRVFERIGRMVRADVHGVMDRLEERSLLLRQHLREAELEVARKRSRLEAIDAERHQLREEGARLERRVAELDEDVELARRGEDPELARFAVRRLLPQRSMLRECFARAAELEATRVRVAETLEEQEAELEALRPRVRAALLRPDPLVASPVEGAAECLVSDEEVELELLRRRQEEGDGRRLENPTGEGA